MRRMPLFLIALLGGSLLSGCVTNPTPRDPIAEIGFWSYLAASSGTQYALLENPARRPVFEQTLASLNDLVATNNFDAIALHNALSRLPIRELKSPEARLLITTATVLFQRYGAEVALDRQVYVAAALRGIRDGMQAGLNATALSQPAKASSQ